MLWCALSDAIPLYPLYALLFADAGLSEARISALFAIWSAAAVVAEVPSGALADRFSRRAALVASGLLQGTGYALWLAVPGFAGFAAGFALWGVAGALASGAFQALLHDGLADAGAAHRYGTVLGRAEAAALVVQVPVAGAASALAALGGYALAGLASIAVCLGAAALAATLPDARPAGRARPADGEGAGRATLRAALGELTGSTPVRAAALAVAALAALDGLEEYTPLLAAGWGVPDGAIPAALLVVPLAGAVGAALGGRALALAPRGLGGLLAAAALALAAATVVARPAAIALIALAYAIWRTVLVVADARLQERITGPARATVTSVAGLGAEAASIPLFAAWAAGGLPLVVVLAALVAAWTPRALGGAASAPAPHR